MFAVFGKSRAVGTIQLYSCIDCVLAANSRVLMTLTMETPDHVIMLFVGGKFDQDPVAFRINPPAFETGTQGINRVCAGILVHIGSGYTLLIRESYEAEM